MQISSSCVLVPPDGHRRADYSGQRIGSSVILYETGPVTEVSSRTRRGLVMMLNRGVSELENGGGGEAGVKQSIGGVLVPCGSCFPASNRSKQQQAVMLAIEMSRICQ